MFNNKMSLREWRSSRNITTPNTRVYVLNAIEELLEIYYTDKKVIKQHQETIDEMFFQGLTPISEENTIDSLNDIQVFAINECELMGYDNDLTMNETIKEISSRLQDPTQKIEWQEKIPYGKWKKWAEQPKSTLYEANYADCKVL